jgi:hypothetical protein
MACHKSPRLKPTVREPISHKMKDTPATITVISSVQYIADAPRYSDYLPTVQKMIESMQIKSPGNANQ